jgi:integrase
MTRRGHYGGGSIDPSGEDSFRIRYRINGRRYAKTICGTKADAARALRKALTAGDEGRHVAPEKMTFAQWIDEWRTLKAQNLAAQTLERYDGLIRIHVMPALGRLPLQRITATDIDRVYFGITLAPRTAGLLHVLLKSIFRTAVKKKLLAANPVEDAEKPNVEDEEAGTVLDEAELAELVKAFEGRSLYPIVATAAFTGMRRNEILALRWTDVDFDARTISITRSVEQTKAHGRRLKSPKRWKQARVITIDDNLVGLLRREKVRHLRMVAGLADGDPPVDLSLVRLPEGAMCFPAMGEDLTAVRNPASVTTAFLEYVKRKGFKVRFHDLRGSHETVLLDKGVPVHVVAKRCGHDAAMLLRVYAKRTKKADVDAAAIIGAMTQGVL